MAKEQLAIAVDFDGTVVTHEYPNVGRDIGAVPVLKELVKQGHKLILFTMRDGKELNDAINWYKENDIPLYGIQYNPTQKNWTKSNKCYANLYIDDAALGCPLIYPEDGSRVYVDWDAVSMMLLGKEIEDNSDLDSITDDEWNHFHDVVLTAVGKNLSRQKLKDYFRILPDDLIDDIFHWGLSDTVVRENIIEYLKSI